MGICIGKKSDGGATVVPQDNFAMAELGNKKKASVIKPKAEVPTDAFSFAVN